MFNSEFYPTPPEVIETMQIDCRDKVILEPHAGKGNIIDYCILHGAKQILSMEINKDLQEIVRRKSSLIGEDFFNCTAEQISHVQAIIMNPPFSNADKHIIHAWKIAPAGCEIISLCNYETINKTYNSRELTNLIRDYGITENLGDCFTQAERKTGVEVGLIKLYKPITNADFKFEGFFMDEEEEEAQGEGIMQYNEVRALVNRYVGTMMSFDQMNAQLQTINSLIAPIGISAIKLEVGYNNQLTTKEEFSKTIQKASWNFIFNKMNMRKYVTSGVLQNINKFVETQEKIPFTMKNIYKMFEIIVGTRQSAFNQALEEVIDNFTKHTDENRFGVEGWKTNSGYMLNKKFIINNCATVSYSGRLGIETYRSNFEKLNDLTKVLCNITGENYDKIPEIGFASCDCNENGYLTTENRRVFYRNSLNYRESFYKENDFYSNTWYDWAFFEFKIFKKGTIHLKFKDINHWYLLNKAYGELKGFSLPERYEK
jgi:hypothetical protein